jgi:CRP/FNR family transcriptional regulator, cyclic AMP receptor protein
VTSLRRADDDQPAANRAQDVPGLAEGGLGRLASIGFYRDLLPGATVLSEGQPARHLGVVIDGRLAVRTRVPGHPDATVMTLDAGDIFGWSAVLDSGATATIVALGDARVMLIEREALLEMLSADPLLAAAVYRRLLEVVEDRLAATRMQMLDLYRAGGAVP